MAIRTYNLGHLFDQAFGVRPIIPFNIPPENEVPANIDLTGINVVNPTKHGVISSLGTPVMFPVWFKAGQYFKYRPSGELITVDIQNDLLLPFSTMVDFDREKITSESPASTSIGTVKETYSIGDWNVRIRGLILSEEQGKFNQRAIEDLLRFEELVDVIGVQGTMFNLLDIKKILIKRISLPKTEGMPNVQPFTISAKSDIPLELIL